MIKKIPGNITTLSEAFAKLNIPYNRKYWSGRSVDGSTVVLAVHENFFKGNKYKTDAPGSWCKEFGNKQRIANLKIVRDHLNGMFTAFVRAPSGKVVGQCMMRLTQFNENTGTFSAEVVE